MYNSLGNFNNDICEVYMIETISTVILIILAFFILVVAVWAAFVVALPMGLAMLFVLLLIALRQIML